MLLGNKIRIKDQGGRAVWCDVECQIKAKSTDYINSMVNRLLWTKVMDEVGEISRYKIKI